MANQIPGLPQDSTELDPAVESEDFAHLLEEEESLSHYTPPVEGYVMLSHKRAENREAWEILEKAFKENSVLQGKVTGVTKGGLNIDVGVPAFLPGSQVDVRPVHNLEQFVGQEIPVRIVKLNQ